MKFLFNKIYNSSRRHTLLLSPSKFLFLNMRISAIEPEEPEEQIRSNNEPCSNQSNKNFKF